MVKVSTHVSPHVLVACLPHVVPNILTNNISQTFPPWLGALPHGRVAADGDGGRRAIIRRRRLPTVAGCAINDGDGVDMLWMQLVKVGNVFDRAKAPAWAQPRHSYWTTMFLWESRRRRRAAAAAITVRPLLQL